jgi:hypothetical protein
VAGWLLMWLIVFKKIKHKLLFIAGILAVLMISIALISQPRVQNYLVKQATGVLSNQLKTKVEIKHVNFSLFNKMLIEGILIQDKQKDTLLYAGTAKVNITDWFFIKDKATLHYLALQNTVLNLNRTDSVWNYQFLIDFFSSPSKTTAKNKQGLVFDFKKVELENIRFNNIDKWVGQDMVLAITKGTVEADSFDIDKKLFVLNNIALMQPYFAQSNYTGNRKKLGIIPYKKVNAATTPLTFKWNNDGWVFRVKNLQLANGTFKNQVETERNPYDYFDGQHLAFTQINGNIKNVSFIRDTLYAAVNLTTTERSGFTVKKLSSNLKFTPDIMEFNNLDIITNKSRLRNYYAMKYENFNSDMNDFLHSVTLNGNFENSTITSDDIAFFAPALKTWKKTFEINGTAKGTIDNLVTKNMVIKSGNTYVDGDIALRGLPNITSTFIDFKSRNLITNYNDLITIIPTLKNVTQPKLSKLGNIIYKGNFTGFINDFVTYGTINTSIGTIIADVNMKLPENKPATYSGKILSNGFNVGQFVGNNTLGNIALDGNVVGSGFTLKELQAGFKGNVKQIFFNGYNYNNILIDGKFNKNIFSGTGSVNDPNLRVENFSGTINLSKAKPTFNFNANVLQSNFKKLKLFNEDFSLTGKLNLDFTGTNIDEFYGTARINNAVLRHDTTKLSFDFLQLKSYTQDGIKHLEFGTNEVEGNIAGTFNILQLPDAFSTFLSRYYPAYIKAPKRNISTQNFTFNVSTKNADPFVQLLDKRLRGFNDATFSGNLNLAKSELSIKGFIPNLAYDKIIYNNATIESQGNLDTLITKITTGDIAINDSLHFPGTDLLIKSHNDVSLVQIKTSASKTLSEAAINATVTTLNDGVKVYFSPSSFIINDKKWELEKDGELTIRRSYIDASEVKFTQGNQEIVLATEEAENGTDDVNVVARLKNVNINDFTPLFLKSPRLEGILTGTVTLSDPFGKQFIEYDAAAENFKLDDELIGNVPLNGSVNTQTGLIKAKASTNNNAYKFKIDGTYNFKDSSQNQMDFDFDAERFDLSMLNKYLGAVFSDIRGTATSTTLKLKGGAKKQEVTGIVNVDTASLKVNFTQCTYKLNNKSIIFNPNEIDFGTLQLKDTLGNIGSVSGRLYHNFFDNFYFDNVSFKTGTDNSPGKMLLLNTTRLDNSQFYGKAIGSAKMSIDGPITDMRMNIDGKTSATDSSHIYLPTGDSKEGSKIDYIEFVRFGREMEVLRTKAGTNILINMDVEATPACQIDVILDEATGDIVKGKGTGKLNIRVGTKEPISMRGSYNIKQGEYSFNFQTIFKRYFNINDGSTVVWNGDPFDAAIKINAAYVAEKVDLSPLSVQGGTTQVQQKEDVSIIAHLTETLKKPKVDFEFVLPTDNEASKDPLIAATFDRYKQDPNRMNKQVASLLLFNTFINDNGGGLGGSTANFLSGTVGQVISSYLSNQLTRFFQKVFKDPTISPYLSFNSNYDITNPAVINALQASGNLGITKQYLDGRLIVSLGGNIDYNNPYILAIRQTSVLLTPDITVEYLLSKDGRLRIVGFQKTSVDATLGQRNRTGVRLSYQQEFDKKRYRPEAIKPKQVAKLAPVGGT